MKFTVEKIQTMLPVLLDASRRAALPLAPIRLAQGQLSAAQTPEYDDRAWDLLALDEPWGRPGETWWFRTTLQIPQEWAGSRVAVHVLLGDYEDISGPEALAYLDGEPIQGFDYNHRLLILGDPAHGGERHTLALEAYNSLRPRRQHLRACALLRIDREAEALYHDLRVLLGALLTMPEESLERARLLHTLERAYAVLDLRDPQSDAYLQSVPRAREIVRSEGYSGALLSAPRIVAVGHAHIDLAWLWPVAQTRRKGARTLSTVLKLMDEYPDYHFVCSQPALYRMVQEDEPTLYARVKERIAEGRIEPTGAAWVEMDCNLAGAEALVRQFIHGKRFFRQELGSDPRVLWLPDVFGYAAALPQILKGCAVDYFMTTKISWNEYNRLPYDTFRWRGIDGTEVLTHMVTSPLNPHERGDSTMQPFYTYNAKFTPFDVAGDWSAYRQKEINDELLYLFGFGDGGGGPTAEMQETASRLAALPSFPRVEQSSAEEFFQRLETRVWNDPDLPTWVGELYLEYHRGTYTSQAWIKRANRHNELLYREAELWATAVGVLHDPTALTACRDALTPGWESLLFNQFHDILPGSSIAEVYVDARADHHAITQRGAEVRHTAQAQLTDAAGGAALVVFNPAPFARQEAVELRLSLGAARPSLRDSDGTVLPVQELSPLGEEQRLLVGVSAPALGYRVLPLAPTPATATPDNTLHIAQRLLENRFFRLELDEHGEITSLLDKRVGREVIAPGERGNRFQAFEDRPLNFDAWDINIYYADKPYPVDTIVSWEVVERGPLRGGVEIVRRYGQSTIRQRILLHADLPRIDFPTEVEWHEQQTLLKVAFPVTVNSPRATFDIQWGNLERPTHWNTSWDWARFETCAHKWADLSEGDYGVSLLNDCKYGHDIKGHTLRLSLLKGAIYPDPQADQGHHEFSYALLPHPGDWRDGETVRHAYLFNMPPSARLSPDTGTATATTDQALSLVATDRPGLVIETVKPAEDGDGLIVRLYDAHNTRGEATLTFVRPIASVEETTMLEESLRPLAANDNSVTIPVRPYGISTLRVRLSR